MFLYPEAKPRVEVMKSVSDDDKYEGVYRPPPSGPKCLDRKNWMDPVSVKTK